MLKILLTGATGFIGTHLLNRLLKENVQIVLLTSNKDYQNDKRNVQVVCLNFFDCTDDDFNVLLRDIDIVYHLLWTTNPRENRIYEDICCNATQSVRLLDACVRNKVKKLIFPSTGGALYGNSNEYIIKESSLPSPISSYGLTKLFVEKYIELQHHHFGLEYVTLRISSAYGEFQGITKLQGVISTWINKILLHEPIEIWGNGDVIRDYIYAEDVAEALYKSIYCSHSQTLNLGTGIGYSLNEIIILLKEVSNIDFNVVYKESNKNDVKSNILDITKATEMLHWQPINSISQGIDKTFNFYKSIKY